MSNRFMICLIFWFAAAGAATGVEIIVPETAPTLEKAMEGLSDGDRIVLLPGEYTVRLNFPEGVGFSLVGRDGAEKTILRGADDLEPVLAIRAKGRPVEIRGLTFDRTDARSAYSIMAAETELTLDECVFLQGAGLAVDTCTGVIRANRFEGCFNGIRLVRSPMMIDGNLFLRTVQYAITARASRSEIVRNKFRETGSCCIVIVGKRIFPSIGGARGKGNIFVRNPGLLVANESRNDINAQFNYWGPVVTSSMVRLGYPANIPEFQDKWDSDDRASGEIDYRNWLDSEVANRSGMSPFMYGTIAALCVIVVIVVARRKKAGKA